METRTEIKDLHQRLGKTMVYVTHDQVEAMTLANRIAVLNHGRVEQLGTPEEVYLRPASLFVAGFVGSPGMNILKGQIREGRFLSERGPGPVVLPRGYDHLVEGMAVTLGIRPENLDIAEPQDAGAMPAVAEVVELTGPEKHVVLRLGAERLKASLPPDTTIAAGTRCHVRFSQASIVLFDSATGRRIEATPGVNPLET
jgi:multiple sugar transport system ATP-binding protein